VDFYSQERWLLERHAEMVRSAEDRSRLEGWEPRVRLGERVAARLRRLADRIEGEQPVKLRIYGG
jgi:hypothetical protein